MTKLCLNCNNENNDVSKFCQNCGSPLINENRENKNNMLQNIEQKNVPVDIDTMNSTDNNKQLYSTECTMLTDATIMSYLEKFTSYKDNIIVLDIKSDTYV